MDRRAEGLLVIIALWNVVLSDEPVSKLDNVNGTVYPPPVLSTVNNVTWLTLGNTTFSFHPIHPDSPFAVSQYSITCCRDGSPEPDPSLSPYIHEWSQEMVGEERNKSCRRFNGYYSVPSWVMQQHRKLVVGVRCKCPDNTNLDRNCRYLPDCANGGYRSFSINLRCVCPPQWFGQLCEKFCLNGALYKEYPPGDDGLGVDRCKCYTNFYGEACDEVACFNGGTAVKQRGCICATGFIGPHCEETTAFGQPDSSSTSSFHRDLSSSVVSIFLAVALALGVYFLVRRRTRWMRQRARARRAAMMDANPPSRPDGPPPIYYRNRPDQSASADPTSYDLTALPPPPAYHDVVKAPPAYMAPSPIVVQTSAIRNEGQSDHAQAPPATVVQSEASDRPVAADCQSQQTASHVHPVEQSGHS